MAFFSDLKIFFHKHEAKLSALALIAGFTFDYLTLNRVDFLADNIFILLYIILAGASIFIINLYEAGRVRNKFTDSVYEFLPFILQFAFGGLFSAFVIFYSKSASFLVNGAFVLILLSLLIGNEFFRKKYSKLTFQVAIYFVALFSFSIYLLPVLIKKMGVWVFLGSGAISLALIGAFIFTIYKFAPTRYKESEKFVIGVVGSVFVFINILYFTNIIPPIPISLKDAGVYHLVERQPNGDYLAMGEQKENIFDFRQTIHIVPGESVYVFSSVFAPTDLNINITHDWQYHDEEDGWVSASRISFPIRGGRDMGFRGYSQKQAVFPGKWRVDIKTERGQVIGRVRFDIETGPPPSALETRTL